MGGIGTFCSGKDFRTIKNVTDLYQNIMAREILFLLLGLALSGQFVLHEQQL